MMPILKKKPGAEPNPGQRRAGDPRITE